MSGDVEMIQGTIDIEELVRDKVSLSQSEGLDNSFSIFDLGEVISKYQVWAKYLPRVKPFYAVKCNNDDCILRVLAACGASFECASQAEIEQVIGLGVSADNIIYANTCKHPSMVKFSAKEGVAYLTFDNEAELYKIKENYPDAKILPSGNFKAKFDLGEKFGCPVSTAKNLLTVAKKLHLNVMGISFHVGSVCQEVEAFAAAIKDARTAIDLGLQMGLNMRLLDIGGGFPGEDSDIITFRKIAEDTNAALGQFFPLEDNIDIIAEPGRYFVTTTVTVATNIIGKRVVVKESNGGAENGEVTDPVLSGSPFIMYHIGEGMYGWLSVTYHENLDVPVYTLKNDGETNVSDCTIWGPTCDALDCIKKRTRLQDHEVGEWLYFRSMGAYTLTCATYFNSMPAPRRYYYCQQDMWLTVHQQNK